MTARPDRTLGYTIQPKRSPNPHHQRDRAIRAAGNFRLERRTRRCALAEAHQADDALGTGAAGARPRRCGYGETVGDERQRDAIELIKWKEIYDNLERTLDEAEDVANVVESITIKHT